VIGGEPGPCAGALPSIDPPRRRPPGDRHAGVDAACGGAHPGGAHEVPGAVAGTLAPPPDGPRPIPRTFPSDPDTVGSVLIPASEPPLRPGSAVMRGEPASVAMAPQGRPWSRSGRVGRWPGFAPMGAGILRAYRLCCQVIGGSTSSRTGATAVAIRAHHRGPMRTIGRARVRSEWRSGGPPRAGAVRAPPFPSPKRMPRSVPCPDHT
jgi:hypothetical protein